MKRYPRKTGPGAHAPFLEGLRARPKSPRPETNVDVVASTCTGLMRLSTSLGVELHHIGCHAAAARQADELSMRGYGARVITGGPAPFEIEDGWRDWRIVPLRHEMVGGAPLASGARLRVGRLAVVVEPTIPRASFARRLALLMDHLRFDAALTSGRVVARRHKSGAVLGIAPRYAGSGPDDDWERAAQIYVFDPWRDLARLAALSCAAATEVVATGEA